MKKKINIHLEKLQCVFIPFIKHLTTVHFISMNHLWVKSSMGLTLLFVVQPYLKILHYKSCYEYAKMTDFLLHEWDDITDNKSYIKYSIDYVRREKPDVNPKYM